MTGIIAVSGIVSPRDATLIKAVVEGMMPEIGALVREATAPLIARIADLEQRGTALPEKGDTGEQGPQGEPGPAGEVDMEAVKALVAAAVADLPPAERGEKGEAGADGLPGEKGADGAPGEPGRDGKDGIGLADALIDKDGRLVLTMTDGRTKSLGLVVGKDGAPGATFTLDDFDVEPLDERTICLGFTKGTEKHAFELKFPVLIGRGIWNAEGDYERGDVTTWGGTAWEAVEPEKGVKPDQSSGGWRILAKRGRDGK